MKKRFEKEDDLRKEIKRGVDSGEPTPLDIDTIKARGRKRLVEPRKEVSDSRENESERWDEYLKTSDAMRPLPGYPRINPFHDNSIRVTLGDSLPDPTFILRALLLGACSYGMSLVLFVYALRYIGTSRTATWFQTAPFIGAAVSFLLLREPLSTRLAVSGLIMLCAATLLLREYHAHEHEHPAIWHEHRHDHDEHHRHEHEIDQAGPHAHPHYHSPLLHFHMHLPDFHHRHNH